MDCTFCSETGFTKETVLREHVIYNHPQARAECPDCVAIRPIGDLVTHLVTTHGWTRSEAPAIVRTAHLVQNPSPAKEKPMQTCPDCSEEIPGDSPQALGAHRRYKHPGAAAKKPAAKVAGGGLVKPPETPATGLPTVELDVDTLLELATRIEFVARNGRVFTIEVEL